MSADRDSDSRNASSLPKPPWIRVRIPSGESYEKVRSLVREQRLHTVCAEALCPNLGECWGRGTATFMILGSICTRNCRFCGVRGGAPEQVDPSEPGKVAEAVSAMNLNYAVITSVTRDDLPDGGAGIFAATIEAIREKVTCCGIEVLVPDFRGDANSIRRILNAGPDVFAHNVETVPRLYRKVRELADYRRSLDVLATAKSISPDTATKSGIMVGIGETPEEIMDVMADLKAAGCDILTIGQYLSPTRAHVPVARYYSPREFDKLRDVGMELGFGHVESGPLVRSSYHADRQATGLKANR